MTYRTIDVAELVRLHALRAPRLQWLLGAGVSAAAGIPTAGQLIDEFKLLLYCSEAGVNRRLVDFAEPAAAHKAQAYFDADPRFPPPGAAEEYSTYFELAMRDAKDRRAFLQQRLTNRQPTYAHYALGVLMAIQQCRLVWTTNFDPLLDDAVARVFDRASALTTVEPETSARVSALTEERWPIQVKLHGDFRSDLLKNTEQELQQQDAHLRRALVDHVARGGLIVVGYSGRDASVMEALTAATAKPDALPDGLYWCHFGGGPPLPAVQELLTRAAARDIDACLVATGPADEVLGRLLDVIDVPDHLQLHLDQRQPDRRCTPMQLPPLSGNWPRITLNGLRVDRFPHTCRLINCEIGGAAEVRAAITDVNSDVIATRRSDGVIAFGADAELHRCFDPYDVKGFDIAHLDASRLWRERSADLTILYDGIARALTRDTQLAHHRRRGSHLLVMTPAATAQHADACKRLRSVAGQLTGTHAGGFAWAEAIRLRLEQRFGVLWLVYEPTVWVEPVDDTNGGATRTEFVRERQATRYNRAWSTLLGGWGDVLCPQSSHTINAFGLGDRSGADATFTLLSLPAHAAARTGRRP